MRKFSLAPRLTLCGLALGFSLSVTLPSEVAAGGLVAAHPFAKNSAVDVWGGELAECIGASFGIPVELLPAGTIGLSGDVLDALGKGQLDLAILPVSTIAQVWPGMGLLLEPGAMTNPKDALRLSASESFIRAFDELGGREVGLSVIAVGWQYQVLGVREANDDNIEGKRIRTLGEPNMRLLSLLGAKPVVLPRSEVFFALGFGVIDGAVVGVDELEYLSAGKGGPLTLVWSNEFIPFASPLAVVMGSNAERNWGEKLLFVVRSECSDVTERFNRQSIEQAIESIRVAEGSGVRVVDYDRKRWQEVTEKTFEAAAERTEAGALARELRP